MAFTIAAVLSDVELLEIGAALRELKGTKGWGVFEGVLEKFEQDVGRAGLRDRNRSRQYYEGYMDAIIEVRHAVSTLIDEAEALKASAEEEESAILVPRVGVGATVSGS